VPNFVWLLSQLVTPVLAATALPAPVTAPAPPPVDTGKQLSRHLRCDGNPPAVALRRQSADGCAATAIRRR